MKSSALYPELIVEHLERSVIFYVDILGFDVSIAVRKRNFIFLSFGDAQLMLLQDNENQHSRAGSRRLSENRLIYCGRDILASFSRKFRRIEQLFTSNDEKI